MDEEAPLDPQMLEEAYAHLRRLAARIQRARGADAHHPTSLVHDVFERLARNPELKVRDRAHLLALGARAMRHVLADRARRQAASKRGGAWDQVSLEGVADPADTSDFVALQQALDALRDMDVLTSEITELRILGGLTDAEIAEATATSERTVRRKSRAGRAWLQARLGSGS